MRPSQAPLNGLERLSQRLLVLKLDCGLLQLGSLLQQGCVSLDVGLLFALIAAYPDLFGVFLCSNKVSLLLDLVHKLFELDFALRRH